MVQLLKQAVKKNSGGGCGRLDGVSDDTEFELWDSRFMLRGDHEPEIGYKHARWGPRGWCKPSCIPITIILILIVLVVLLPLMEQKEAGSVNSSPRFCPQTCRFSLVESIPEGLTYPNNTAVHPTTHDVWFELIKLAQHSIEIGSFYWTLRSADITPGDPSSLKGDEIFQALLTAGLEKKVNIRIAQNFPSQSQSSPDTEILAKTGAAEVRSVNFPKLMGGGVLHTKLWIIDEKHFYVGSANMDWRSLTEVKELGLSVYNCSCLASDLAKIFEVYWFLGNPDAEIPAKWPDSLSTHFNMETPMTLVMNASSKADVYLASSPPPFCPEGRSTDIDAIIHVISTAEHFIYISVMDYFPLQIYTPRPRYWPKIDDALRSAAIDRHVKVRLLISNWNHTRKAAQYFLRSLIDINGAYRGVVVEVKWFRVPSTPEQAKIPFARVNHNKYMVTDNAAYIGTSNWSGDYFIDTAGVGIVVRAAHSSNDTSTNPLCDQLQQVFERDWNSSYVSPLL
ncbi:Phospholipase D3 [Cryptotermes secundus]|uniref:Phospholipase D3 n=1 Tax=Cryptotermes secundus TaxID=105785 RepID=A0A2J7QXM5_9NEOP|nr:phospholipase D3 isoform X2 [Cryptotermes secundus]PNF33342.1 Phospholipase D3 [Cryptotermes secundus]